MSNRKLNLYRMVNGQRLRVVFEVDDQLTILSEKQDSPPDNEQTRELKARGYTINGNEITHVPAREQEIFRFFSEHTPCWFPECEAMRKQYNEELESLPQDCPTCQKGALIRKYAAKVGDILAPT